MQAMHDPMIHSLHGHLLVVHGLYMAWSVVRKSRGNHVGLGVCFVLQVGSACWAGSRSVPSALLQYWHMLGADSTCVSVREFVPFLIACAGMWDLTRRAVSTVAGKEA